MCRVLRILIAAFVLTVYTLLVYLGQWDNRSMGGVVLYFVGTIGLAAAVVWFISHENDASG